MRIVWYTPYKKDGSGRYSDPVWPAEWPLPSIGSSVTLPEGAILWVHGVDFFPSGDGDNDQPFVYIALHDRSLSRS